MYSVQHIWISQFFQKRVHMLRRVVAFLSSSSSLLVLKMQHHHQRLAADLILLNPMKFAFVVNATAQRRQRDILAIVFRTDHFLTTMVAQTKRRDKEDLPYTHTYVSSFYVYILSIYIQLILIKWKPIKWKQSLKWKLF